MKRYASSLIFMFYTFSENDNHSKIAYIGSYPDDYLSGSLLKDGGLTIITAQSSSYIEPSP